MKLIYATSLLPLSLAMPGKDDNKGKDQHPCMRKMKTLGDQEDCIHAMYEEFDMVMQGEFPKKMRKGIKKMVDRGHDMVSSPSTPSTPSTPSLPTVSFPPGPTCSQAQLSLNGTLFGVDVPCENKSFCMYGLKNWDFTGNCQVCPPTCDINLPTFIDYENCCQACPNSICDLAAWDEKDKKVVDAIVKEKMMSGNYNKPTFVNQIQITPNIDVEEFLVWFDRTLNDSRKQPGLISVEVNEQLTREGDKTGAIRAVFKWVTSDDYWNYARWRYFRGMYWDLAARSEGQWDTREGAASNMEYFIYRGDI